MKNQKGITLVSLIIYVIVMVIVLTIMSSIISKFYSNMGVMHTNVQEILEFNKFNIYFLKEIKQYNNKLDTINANYILFSSGNSFSFNSNKIYYNNIQICKNVKNINFETGKRNDENGNEIEDKTIVKVTINFENFSKTISYKIENIY